eukprot:8172568-Alexandrium_andersonii.AAC.1
MARSAPRRRVRFGSYSGSQHFPQPLATSLCSALAGFSLKTAIHACPGMPRTCSAHEHRQCARTHSICTRMPATTKKTSGTQLILCFFS